MGGDRSLLQLVVRTALEEAPRLMKAIEEAAGKRDAAALRLAAHTLQGAIRYFGPTSVFDQVCLLERTAQEGRSDEAAAMAPSLRECLDRLMVTLTQYVSEAESPNGT